MLQFLSHIPLFGSFVNALFIAVGSLIGLTLRKRLPRRLLELPVMALALYVMILGISFSIKSQHPLIMVASLGIGSIIGELIDLEGRLERFAKSVESRFDSADGFARGFVSCTLLFCTGSMAVLGSFEEGMGAFPVTLLTKGLIDGFASIAMSATLGVGVIFSAIPIILYQGSLTMLFSVLQPVMTPEAIAEMSAVGGIMLIAICFGMLDIKKFRVMNMLPALIVAVFMVYCLHLHIF